MYERSKLPSQVINHHQAMVGGLYLLGGGMEVDTSYDPDMTLLNDLF